jgi:hypothetical protein
MPPQPTPPPDVSPGSAGPVLSERRQAVLDFDPARPSPVATHPRNRRYQELPGEWTREQYPFFS